MNRSKLIIIFIVVIISFIFVSYLLLQLFFPKKTPISINTPTTPEGSIINQIMDQDQINRDSKVGQLIHKMPYSGQYFVMDYNFYSNQFIVTILSGQDSQANQELDQFLVQNNINNRSWIKNLTFTIKSNE